jgi:serine/threonine protein kinase
MGDLSKSNGLDGQASFKLLSKRFLPLTHFPDEFKRHSMQRFGVPAKVTPTMSFAPCKSLHDLRRLLPSFVVHKKDFKMGRRIGKGAFSVVYVGVHKCSGRLCAIKILNYKNLKHDRFQLFEREVRVLAASESPCLIRFVGFTLKHPFTIVTEYVPNGSLYDALRPAKGAHVLTGTQKTIIAMGIAHGMRRLHEIGVAHRDLKSLNVLLDARHYPQICDFGLSRYALDDPGTYLTARVGTVNWMAPECFQGGRYGVKVDVYSYAMVLWELLTGHSPFGGKSPQQVEDLILMQGRRPPVPADTPRGLQELIGACWDRNPQRRPSFDQILADFKSHKARFRNCDDDAIDGFIKEMADPDALKDCPASDGADLPEHLKSDQPDEDPFALPIGDGPTFPVMGSPTFPDGIKGFAAHLTVENCDRFFRGLREFFRHELPASHLLGIFTALVSLFAKDRAFVALFTSFQLHASIPIKPAFVSHEFASVFLHLFAVQPEAIDKRILHELCSLAPQMPGNLLSLINQYVTYEPRLKHVDVAFQSLFDNATDFLTCECFINELQTYFLNDSYFQNEFKSQLAEPFQKVLQSNQPAPTKEAVFTAIMSLPALSSICSSINLENLLMDPMWYKRAIDICSKYQASVAFNAEPIRALVCNAQTYYAAIQVLICACQSETEAVLTANLIDIWISAKLPTLNDTVRLLMAVLKFPAAAQLVAGAGQLPNLFLDLIALDDQWAVRAILVIVKSIPVKPDFVQKCGQSSFLDQCYRMAVSKQDPVLLASAFAFTDIFARVAFADQYLLLVPTLKRLLTLESWRGLAVSLLATISIHGEAKEMLCEYEIPALIAPFQSDPALGPYANCFLKHIPS